MTIKRCSQCLIEKHLDEFCKNNKGLHKRSQKCKICTAIATALHRKHNYNKVYANKYKTTEEEISKLLEKEVCEICAKAPNPKRRNVIDHCHTTGKVMRIVV